MAQSFIFFGKSSKQNFEKAEAFATEFLLKNCSISKETLKKHVQNKTYPNLFILEKSEKANEITIDEARDVIQFLSQTPTIIGNRSVIIQAAEFLSKNSANCLLKILEEPPLDSIVILTTKKLFSIIPTIRSRCVKVNVKSEAAEISNYSNVDDFIKETLAERDQKDFIERVVNFLKNKMQGIQEFSKTVESSDLELFCEICNLYSYFSFWQNPNLRNAQISQNIQNMTKLAKNTFPEKQSLVVAMRCIFDF